MVVAINVKDLKEALDKKDPFDRLTNRDKAFIECAKIFTVVCAGAINMLNVFATTMSYNNTIRDFKRMRPVVKHVFLALTIAMLPYTVCVAGFSHAVAYKTAWINMLSLCMLVELCYTGVLCFLCGYFLTETDEGSIWAISLSVTLLLLLLYFWLFRRPDLMHCGPKEEKVADKRQGKSRASGA